MHYLLTDVKSNEYTEATTGQLVDPNTRQWDYELIERLGFPTGMFYLKETTGAKLSARSPPDTA